MGQVCRDRCNGHVGVHIWLQVDFLPSSDMSEEDRAALIAAQAAAAADTRMAHTVIDGQERPFHVSDTPRCVVVYM